MALTSQNPKISVCVPVYNASQYLRECIDSILSQEFEDFELLMVDDGSTDESCEIIESYSDERIRLIRNRHDFIHTQNTLLSEARGKYIARIDNDDRMLPARLQVQYDYMEVHPEVDVLGTGSQLFGGRSLLCTPLILHRAITMQEMLKGNYIVNPTVMLRRSTIERYSLRCEERYKYSDDYGLWMKMLSLGLHIENIPDILTEYRISESQASCQHSDAQKKAAEAVCEDARRFIGKPEKEAAERSAPIVDTGKKLTLIIPFLNEGAEVMRTVASAREYAGQDIDILVINDRSDDGYPYYEALQPYHVYYVYNEERKGVAASRDLGVRLCQTPYFLLLDAHMRFYDDRWFSRIVSLLENDDRCLLCSQTRVLWRDDHGEVHEHPADESLTTYGAYIPFLKENYLPDVEWNFTERCVGEATEPIAVVLGAGYAGSKRYWTYLRGLEGLRDFGSDEALISLKVWLEGGRCLLLKDIAIGHIYRKEAPYLILQEKTIYNNLYIANLLFPPTLRSWSHAVASTKNKDLYRSVCATLQASAKENREMKKYLDTILTVPFKQFLELQCALKPPMKETSLIEKENLLKVSEWLPAHLPVDSGISEGKAGVVLWLFHYARYSGKNGNPLAHSLLGEIDEAVKKHKLPLNFKYGLCGIGWLYMYLYANKFLRHPGVEMLQSIDHEIEGIKCDRIADLTMNYGTGGTLCYLSTRLKMMETNRVNCSFCSDFLEEMEGLARRVITDSTDIYACFHAFQYLLLRAKDVCEEDWKPQLTEWLDFPNALPEDTYFWKPGLFDGCAGYTLPSMLLTKNTIE